MIDTDLIVKLLIELQKQSDDKKKQAEEFDEEDYVARLKNRVFGDPYPPKKKEDE